MAYSNGKITSPVSIYDIQQALGTSDNNILTLCQESQINKFAKWKPFRNTAVKFDSELDRLTAAKAVNYGTSIVSCGRTNFASNYQNKWSHLAPRGTSYNEWGRFNDWKDYQHNKWQLGIYGDGRGMYTIFNGQLNIPGTRVSDLDIISFTMQCREDEENDANLGLLYPYDFAGCQKDISQYYVGIVILDSNNGVWVYADQQVSDYYTGTLLTTEARPQLSNSIPNGALKIVPVLTQYRQTSWSSNYNGDIIILDGAYLSATKVAQTANLITSVTFNLTSTKITLTFTVTNQTGSSVTINNMVCYLLSDAAFTNEHDIGYTGPDYQGEGAATYIQRTWPQNYKQNDIYSSDWQGGYSSPNQLAARYYNAYSGFVTANGGTNTIGNNTTRTWTKEFNYTQDDFGSYSNGAWAMLCLAPQGNVFVREYSSLNS